MGVSTDGLIFFGWVFDEGHEFPWDEYDEEDWWRKEQGYKPPFEIYNAEGEYLNGRPPQSKIREYHDHRNDWLKANPLPFEMENYCSGESPMWAITVPGVGMSARRGYPEVIGGLPEIDGEAISAIVKLLTSHGMAFPSGPHWHLASYWG